MKFKTLFKKTLISLMALGTALTNTTSMLPTKAATHTVTTGASTGYNFQVTNADGIHSQWDSNASMIYVDGEVAFCIQPGYVLTEGNNFISSQLTWSQKDQLSIIAYEGWEKSSKTNEDWLATQFYIWETLGATINSSSFLSIYNKTYKPAIKARIAKHDTRPSFHNGNYEMNVGESITLTDTNGVLSDFYMTSDGGATVSKNGNKLTITAVSTTSENISIDFLKIPQQHQGISLIYSNGSQDVGRFYLQDPIQTWISVKVNKTGSLKLTKQDEDGTKVPNTSFKVSKNKDMSSPIGTYTTGNDGSVTVNDLLGGTYYIQESSVPNHLNLDTTVHTVTVTANQTATFTATNTWKKGKIKLRKVDSQTRNQVGGATYTIYNAQGQEVERLVVPKTGYIESGYLRFGNYTVKEVIAPTGYVLNTQAYSVAITQNEQRLEVTAEDKPIEGKIRLKKADSLDGSQVGGAVYGIYDASGNEVQRLTTQAGAYVESKLLRYGTYTVKEITAPTGYVLNTKAYTVQISTEGQVATVNAEDKPIQGYIQVVKKDVDTGKTVTKANTTFSIYKSNDTYVGDITTNNNGTAKSGLLRYGDYYLVEKTAPNGYTKSTQKITYKIREEGKTYSAELSNKRVTGSLTMTKVDSVTGSTAQGESTLEGAVYGLYARENIVDPADGSILYKAGTKVKELKTDAKGKASITNLFLGKYYLKEISASKGYTLDTTEYDVVLSYKDQNTAVITKTQTVKERVIAQAFELIKISDNNSGEADILEGVEFTIKSQADIDKYGSWEKAPIAKNAQGKEAKVLVTDKKGYALSEELPYGTYVVRETKVPDDLYQIPDFTVTVSKDSRDPQPWRVFNDVKFRSVIAIVKQDAETNETVAIAGATFKIRSLKTNDYVGYWEWTPIPHYVTEWSTSEAGTVMTGDVLDPGEYQLEEIKAPNGYLINTQPVKFKVSMNTAYETLPDGTTPVITVIMKDTSVKGRINVEKKGEVLTGVETDMHGNKHFVYTEQGLANAEYTVYAKEDIMNPADSTEVLYKAGTKVDTVVTTKDGKAQSKLLPLGTYEVKETKAPNGFVLNGESQVVTLTYADENTAVVFEDTSFVNERQKVDLSIVKQDADTKQALSGAIFGLYAKEDILSVDGKVLVHKDELIYYNTSTTNGLITFDADLPLSTYYAKEIKAPIGYTSSDEVVDFDATYQGQDVKVVELSSEFENKITTFEISKVDITNQEELAGASLTIYEKGNEGYVFDSWISTDKPHVIKGLEPNKTYVLKEVSSPYGFAIAESIEFTVKDTGEVQKVKMEDDLVLGQLEWNKTGEIFNQVLTGQNEFGTTKEPVWNKSNILGAEITIFAAHDIKIGNTTYYKADEKVEVLESDLDAVTSKKLPVGRYYYVETKVPHGYVIDTEKHYFEIEDNQSTKLQVINSTLYNVKQKVEIDMTKVLEEQSTFIDKDAYKDVVFGIFAREDIYDYMGNVAIENGSMISSTGITKEGKLANIPDLPIGTYYIKELTTNKQYVLNDKEYDFEIAYQGKDVSKYTIMIGTDGVIENELARGSIKVVKSDADTGKKLKDVAFNISTNKDMKGILDSKKTNDKGIIEFTELELGTYYIQEAKQVNGYVYNDHIYEVTVSEDGIVLEVDVVNQPTEMEFSKTDITTGKELPGATIQVIEKDTGKVIDEWVSTEESHKIKYLVEGKEYIMKEITAPDGYVTAEEIEFVAGDGKKIEMKDDITKVDFSKTDFATGEELEGATIQVIEKETGKVIDEWVSTKEPHRINKLTVNKEYIMKEITAPYGYEIAEEITFTVKDTGEVQKVEMKDKKILISIEVNKVDSITKKNIKSSDFEFTMYSDAECKNVITTVKGSKNTGIATFENVEYGTYYIKETKAPQGYKLSDEVKKVVIDDETPIVDGVYSFEYVNVLLPSIQIQTSDATNRMLFVAFFVLSGGIITFILCRKKLKQK